MATQKQRRRREREQRHEYVYVDETGNEVEPPAAAKTRPERSAKSGSSAAKRIARPIQPASWPRAIKWGAGLGLAMFIFSLATAKKGHLGPGIVVAVINGSIFVPLIYLMHRFQYRAYEKILAKGRPAKSGG